MSSGNSSALPSYKILMIGDTSVGKSNIVLRYTKDIFLKTQPTIGVEYTPKTVFLPSKQINVKAQIWDTAGMERYRAIVSAHYRNAAGALLVYDITNRRTFAHLQGWLNQLENKSEKDLTIMLLGHKADLQNQRKVSKEEGVQFAKRKGLIFMETSAVFQYKDSIKDAFETLLDAVHVFKSGMQQQQRMKLKKQGNQKQNKLCCV